VRKKSPSRRRIDKLLDSKPQPIEDKAWPATCAD
jgi:hypothetical protein